jgi:hypothetical protein
VEPRARTAQSSRTPACDLIVVAAEERAAGSPLQHEPGHGGIQGWSAALDTINSLQPSTVIAGHKRDGAEDNPDNIERTRRYPQDFDAAAQRTDNVQALYEAMIERYPDRINRAVVWNSAHAMKG